MKYNKLTLYTASTFLVLLIIIGIFPRLFTSKSPINKYMQGMLPNSGKNSITINNTHNSQITIDSLKIFSQKELLLMEYNLTIETNENYTSQFVIKTLDQIKDKQITIELCGVSKDSFSAFINKTIPVVLFPSTNCLSVTYTITNFNKWRIERNKNGIKVASFLGTDYEGYDIWSRLIFGTNVILKIVFFSTLISVPLGVVLGLIRGYYNNLFSSLLGVVSSFANSISIYLLTMLIVFVFGHKILYVIIGFSLIQWVEIEKLIYERVRNIKKNNFVLSAKMFGKSNLNIIISEIVILCIPQIIIGSAFLAKRIILIESSLGFLNASVNVPYPSWGVMISSVTDQIFEISSLRIILPPMLFIIFTLLSFNVIEKYLQEKYKNA